MYAIIEESGGQRTVREGDEIIVNLHESGNASPGTAVTFDRVLFVGGDAPKIGRPYIPGATVTGEIVTPMVMGEKIHIYKIRPKKGYRRKTGHRQRYTTVKITGIKA